MNVQLIFLVETNKECQSDWIYINTFVKHYYPINENIKLSVIYLGSKDNYYRKEKAILELKKKYHIGKSIVILCIDLDGNDKLHNDKNEAITNYCKIKGYKLVWLNKNIEDVFLKETVYKNDKKKKAIEFAHKEMINTIDIERFKYKEPTINEVSNLVLVLDEIFLNIK